MRYSYFQEDFREEDEDDDTNDGGDTKKSFYAPSDQASFHANSFMELNLSRPLLRACESLGYTKPTPIQVYETKRSYLYEIKCVYFIFSQLLP